MPIAGNTYSVRLKPSHLGWGDYRYTNTRDIIYGEGYIPIPKAYAYAFSIYNSNHYPQGLGNNLFTATSKDGFLKNVMLLAQGCSTAGDEYAKQFSVKGDLQVIGRWYASLKATTSNSIRVTWVSSTEVQLEMI